MGGIFEVMNLGAESFECFDTHLKQLKNNYGDSISKQVE